jgi:hypothetical protein
MNKPLSIAVAFLSICPIFSFGQLQQEKRTVLHESPTTILAGESITTNVELNDLGQGKNRRFLRVVGGMNHVKRGETDFRFMECTIDDHLDSTKRVSDKYSLYFNLSGNTPYQYAYNRMYGKQFQHNHFDIEMYASATDLKLSREGRFGVSLEVYYPKEGRAANDIYDTPDTTLYLPIPTGTYSFQKLKGSYTLPQNPATMVVKVGGEAFEGGCFVEAPQFSCNNVQFSKMPFVAKAQEKCNENYWVGVNLLSRSWPLWSVAYNGKEIYKEHTFDRSSNVADFYVELPPHIEPKGAITLTYHKEAHKAAYPFNLKSIELLEESANDFEVVSVPKYIAKGDTVALLVEINKANLSLNASASSSLNLIDEKLSSGNTGLYAIRFVATQAAPNCSITLTDGKNQRVANLPHILEHTGDHVYISSGDEVYIDKLPNLYDHFFKWYFKARVGNWYHFRPSYQWSGYRGVTEPVLQRYFDLLNKMHVPFAWQVEGRTLAGKDINPPLSMLQSPMFKGFQAHENDGGYYYWNHFKYEGLFTDIRARHLPYGGIFAKHRPIYKSYGTYVHYDPYAAKDMTDGARLFVDNLKYSREQSIRHTGPSSLFRYFYQAGYEWLGAEQMYGPEETIMSALRGASRAYNKSDFGSLHAMQWGSFPFTTKEHAERLYMSLAVAYMHGSSHINTEEALWTDEFANDRFTQSGKEHLAAQTSLYDYIETHSRTGELVSNVAVIQGRNCSWKSFGRSSMWAQDDKKWAFNKINESFDLLKIFYPENIIDASGPNGWFTSTPYGTVDILPIEASLEVMNKYKTLVFLGWNSYSADDIKRLNDFVKAGGNLILSSVHLNSNLQPHTAATFPVADAQIKELLGSNYRSLTNTTAIKRGVGQVIYFPQPYYPSQAELREAYQSKVVEFADASAKDEYMNGWIKPIGKVGFTAWDSPLKRTLYLLNVKWESPAAQQAALMIGSHQFTVDINKEQMATIHCKDQLGVMPLSNTTDVLKIAKYKKGWQVTIQSTEADTIAIFNGRSGETKSHTINKAGLTELFIE